MSQPDGGGGEGAGGDKSGHQESGTITQALGRLGILDRRGKVPFVQGMETADCGAACLAMVLGYFGRHETLASVHAVLQPGRDGVTARTIVEGAASYGLIGRALSVPGDEWQDLPRGTIIHWRFSHFVVYEGFSKKGVMLLDPVGGRRRIPFDEFRRSFTGVAISFQAGDRFIRKEAGESKAWSFVRLVLTERTLLIRIGVISLILQALGLLLPATTSLIIDRVLPRGDSLLLTVVAVGSFLILMSQSLSELLRQILLSNLKVVIDVRMTLRFVEHLLALPYSFFQRHTDGDLLMRISSNAQIREALTGGVISGVLDGALVLGYLFLLFVVSPLIGFMVMLGGAALILPFLLTSQLRHDLASKYIEARTKSESLQVEMLRAIETIKGMGLEHDSLERWSNMLVDTLNVELTRDRLHAVLVMLAEGVRAGIPLLVLVLCAYSNLGGSTVAGGGMAPGTMLALSTLSGLFITRFGALADRIYGLQLLSIYIGRISDVMETEAEPVGGSIPKNGIVGDVVIDKLTYRYTAGAMPVLHNISMHIKEGTAIALVGGSGSGKSTLMKLVAGLYMPSSGDLRIDGMPLHELDLRHYRRHIAMVTQETQLFAGSIRQNIALSTGAPVMSEVIAAAKAACIHDAIMQMPMGYETVLTDQGRSLSGGQRQRLALARALMRKPRLLLLDEATSAIDSLTEERIKRNLDQLHCTRILIAHRLSTIRDVTKIYVMVNGKVVESGNHAELAAKDGVYAKLVKVQNQSI